MGEVAVAVGLRTAAGQGVEGIGESSVRALAKLEQVLPGRLRRRVGALNAFTVPLLRGPQLSAVAPEVLTELANACRDAERLCFEYRDLPQSRTTSTGGPPSASPPAVPSSRTAWCAPSAAGTWSPGTSTAPTGAPSAWTGSRPGRRTARASRPASHRPRTSPRTSPKGSRRARTPRTRSYGCSCPWPEATERISPSAGTLEACDEHSCLLRTRAPNLDVMAIHVMMTGVEFEVVEPAELTGTIRTLRDRLSAALDRSGDAGSAPAPPGSGAV